MAIEAAWWRWEQEQKRLAWQAWTMAALSRAKRLPSLDSVVRPRREFTPEELAERKARHAELAARVNQPDVQDALKQFMEQRGYVGQRKARHRQRTDPGRAEGAR